MTITINETFFYYWIIAIVFETLYSFISIKTQWRKLKKNTQTYQTLMIMKDTFKQVASTKLLWKSIFSPATYIAGYIILCLVAPIFFPFSMFKILRKAIFGKNKLEKKSEEEEKAFDEARQRSEDFMKNEGLPFIENDTVNTNI